MPFPRLYLIIISLCASVPLCLICLWGVNSVDSSFDSTDAASLPVAYKGRFRPLEAYSRLWLYDLYHYQTIQKKDRLSFRSSNGSALDLMLQLHFLGSPLWTGAPLFWIENKTLKTVLELDAARNHFSSDQLQKAIAPRKDRLETLLQSDQKAFEDYRNLLTHLAQFDQLEGQGIQAEILYEDLLSELKKEDFSLSQIRLALEAQYPIKRRLIGSGSTLKMLPGRYDEGEWYSLKALKLKLYHPETNRLIPISNFTKYSEQDFEKIRVSYLALEKAFFANTAAVDQELAELSKALIQGYLSISGTPYQEAYKKQLYYPRLYQLKAEKFYYDYPLLQLSLALYAFSFFFYISSKVMKNKFFNFLGLSFLLSGFFVHTFILGLRCYILQRPPISNMYETVIYVPWIAVLVSLILLCIFRNSLAAIAAAFISVVLFGVVKVTGLSGHLENVQAVLDSQYWLIIHVMMVVGSYGLFCLSGVLGHFYLGAFAICKYETDTMRLISRFLIQGLYLGLTLLISGTILGGVWAAESWGRFWDWDPKESWAFISCCIYLIWIHAHRFKHIGNFGLAIGSIIGLQAISFTWYGVNYILGTGLHSYGFGSGGEVYYYLFLAVETIFIVIIAAYKHRLNRHIAL
jgi:ABC-type transport system involved in cytochrome c biogenesis permease subunit